MDEKNFYFKETKRSDESEKKSNESKNDEKPEFFILKSDDDYKEELIDMLEGVDLYALYIYMYSQDPVKVIKYKQKGLESARKIVACKNRLTEINDYLFQMGRPRLDFSIFI